MYCERQVRLLPEGEKVGPEPEAEPLTAYRDTPAWVLLGEPGSGKTAALRYEASALGDDGVYLELSEFLATDQVQDDWRDRTLFLDGLDEIRGGLESLTLQKIADRLHRLGNPRFRLACRAADWRGSSDLSRLETRSPDRHIVQLALCPLENEDIRHLLREHYQIQDTEKFIRQAEQRGIRPLLGNPITLKLLVEALKQQGDNDWPDSSERVFSLACQQLLTRETNRAHRDRNRDQPLSPEELINGAGELCAQLLLADKQGVATDPDESNNWYPALEELDFTAPRATQRALDTRLFVPAGTERLMPAHRSIAEYLAARWIADRLAEGQLFPHRFLNLILAPDGGLVAGLRGLAAWAAGFDAELCRALLEADPLGLAQYGDVRLLPIPARRDLLQRLVEKAAALPQLRWRLAQSPSTGELATPELLESFQALLQQYQHSEPGQAGLSVALAILGHDFWPMPALKEDLLSVIRDARCWPANRIQALECWLMICDPDEALDLLQAVAAEKIQDPDDGIMGQLLTYAYPDYLPTPELLNYLHPLKKRSLFGTYRYFWRLRLLEKVPDAEVANLLDQLIARADLFTDNETLSDSRSLADKLLIRALDTRNDAIDDDRLYRWLGVGTDQYGLIQRDPEIQKQVSTWLSDRPDRFKAMVRRVLENRCANNRHRWRQSDQERLHGAQHPDDMAAWLLSLMANAKDALAQACATYLVEWANAHHNAIHITLDQVVEWQDNHPERANLLEPLRFYELPSWRLEQTVREVRENDRHQEQRRERTEAVRPLIARIGEGTAEPHIYDQLAKLWHGLFVDISGDTPAERFANYCEIGDELLNATLAGFMACVTQAELPNAHEIIGLRKNDKRHRLDLAVLTGAQLLWVSDKARFADLPEQRLASLIAFHCMETGDEDHDWWPWCLKNKSELTASVLVDYANTLLQAGQNYLSFTYSLAHDCQYETVARHALPKLLKGFPLRARKHQLNHLQYYIQAALHLMPRTLEDIAVDKLTRKSLLTNQLPYWLVAAAMVNPTRHEPAVLKEMAHSRQRLQNTAGVMVALVSQDALNRFSPGFSEQLIELLMDIQSLEFESGLIQLEHRLGELSRNLITRLSADPDPTSTREIERLLKLSLPQELRFRLLEARESQLLTRREQEYRFLDVQQVSKVLRNQSPQSARDLQNLALDVLEQVQVDLKSSNADTFTLFWNNARQYSATPKRENDCRDALLSLMKDKLRSFGVSADPEGDHRNDKRSDIQLGFQNRFSLPLEIKLEISGDLWAAIKEQLIPQYAITPESGRRGIFVLFWFNHRPTPPPPGGGAKPKTAEQLQTMLEEQLSRAEADLIKIVVLDVSR